MSDLPTLPLTIHVGSDGKITTGHPVEDARLARAITHCKDTARKSGQKLCVYEHPERGLEVSDMWPEDLNYIEVYPGGRTVFRPVRRRTPFVPEEKK